MNIFILVILAMTGRFSYADQIIDDIESTVSQYDACTGEGFDQSDLDSFMQLFNDFKNKTTNDTLEVTDYSIDRTTITNSNTKKECSLIVDIYEGRCLYAVCN